MNNNQNNIYKNIEYGKIKSYDGESGTIITKDNEYIFSIRDILGDKELKKGDIVAFRVNNLYFGGEFFKVARFVQKDKISTLNESNKSTKYHK